MWEHIVSWSAGMGKAAQITVVDNLPPDVANYHLAVRYSGRADEAPYGLIEDETG